jgi:hypothetical protein
MMSVMALDTAKQVGFKIETTTKTLTNASGQAMKVDGIVRVFATGRSWSGS